MKKFVALGVICSVLFGGDAFSARVSATAARGRAPATASATNNVSPTPTTSARAAVTRGKAPSTGGTVTKAASGKSGGISARAATTQKVINAGTKIAGATTNTVVSEECKTKYYGCMDSFCMLDNTNGGRCLCSNRNAELDKVLEEIQKLDEQSYAMATDGVERINMGESADAVNAMVEKVAGANKNKDTDKTQKKARKLNLDAWNTDISFADDVSDVFGDTNDLSDKHGDELHAAVSSLCFGQMQECSSEFSMLKMMYTQQIKSDCTAYENSLKQQKNASAKKLQTAQQAMREAALEQYQNQNKYDLGQCTIRFKECMQQTAGCGDDFSKCASIVATENAQNKVGTRKKQASKTYKIETGMTTVEIAAATYDTLIAKKPMCESVTKNCVAVKDKVWDTFLKEAAPEIKSAELIAESNVRMNCIGNISECFQKACKDNIDPNDPDGSYDMCLSRPETMRSLCKVQIDPCVAAEPKILDYVYARLASMRVDSCTTEVKECLQSDDRCGSDYSQCIGLDTDTIIKMCPYDKLVGCQKVYADTDIRGDKVYDEISTMVEGIMLNIDNSMLTQCQNAANEAMVKVCGDTEDCTGLTVDANIGTRSLEYKICGYSGDAKSMAINYSGCRTDISQVSDNELRANTPLAAVLDGTIYWEKVKYADDGTISIPDMEGATAAQTEKIKSELAQLQNSINNAIKAIEADPKVEYCMTGRVVQGMNGKKVGSRNGNDKGKEARFPELTKQMRMIIAQAAVKAAKDNYYKKYDELNEKMLQDYATLGERMAKIAGEDAKERRRDIARQACVSMADATALPKSANPPKNPFGKIMSAVALVGAAVAVPLTGGMSAIAAGHIVMMSAAGAVAGVGLLGNAGSGGANGAENASVSKDLVGSKTLNQWNYKETITSTFEWETLKCHRCTRTQKCSKEKNPIFGDKYCKTWADPGEKCNDIQF